MSENVNRNDCPIPAPEEQKPDKQAIDDIWKKTIGAARVEISTRAVGKAVEDDFLVNDPWEE